MGNESLLVTMGPSRYGHPDEVCLHYPFLHSSLIFQVKRLSRWERVRYGWRAEGGAEVLRWWRTINPLERSLYRLRDGLWKRRLDALWHRHRLGDYDVYQLDGGLCFIYGEEILDRLRRSGKKIVTMYYGSDLRLRGAIPAVEEASHLSLTCEFDHLALYPELRYLFLPFDARPCRQVRGEIRPAADGAGAARSSGNMAAGGGPSGARLRICHSPTARQFKGSDLIIDTVRRLEGRSDVEFVLIEDLPHREAIALKATCDIAIEQVGNRAGTGYGVNSLESLAMGIPTCTDMTDEFEAFVPDHPFVRVDEKTLESRLTALIEDPELRRHKAAEGRAWVERRHDPLNVVRELYRLYREHGIVSERGDSAPEGEG